MNKVLALNKYFKASLGLSHIYHEVADVDPEGSKHILALAQHYYKAAEALKNDIDEEDADLNEDVDDLMSQIMNSDVSLEVKEKRPGVDEEDE